MPKELPPSRVAPQFVVRLPDEGFRDRLAAAAKERGRSMNSEIVARLEASFSDSPDEFAEWERYKVEASHRLRLEQARTTCALMGACYLALYEYMEEGTVEQNRDAIEQNLESAQKLVETVRGDTSWERFQAEYDAAKKRHEALIAQLEAMPAPNPKKKASEKAAKKS